MMDWTAFGMFVTFGAVIFGMMTVWLLIVSLVLVPRLKEGRVLAHGGATGRQNADPEPNTIKPASPGICDELRAWVESQPGRSVYKSDVAGMIAGLQQQAAAVDDLHNDETALIAFGGR